jgi:hypothetical protein
MSAQENCALSVLSNSRRPTEIFTHPDEEESCDDTERVDDLSLAHRRVVLRRGRHFDSLDLLSESPGSRVSRIR